MGRFNFEGLEDKDIFACYVLAGTESGKINEIEFTKLLDQRRSQVKQELVTLGQEIEKLGISDDAFERMGRVYLTSQEHNCTMTEAEEYLTKLDEERNKKDTTAYGKIAKALEVPKYGSPKENVEKLKERPQKEEIEWVQVGTVKLERLKRKYRR